MNDVIRTKVLCIRHDEWFHPSEGCQHCKLPPPKAGDLDLEALLDHARIHDGLGRGDSLALILECRRLRTLSASQEQAHTLRDAGGKL